MKRKLLFKVCITSIIWITYVILYKTYYPIISTQVALNQFQDSTTSFTQFKLFNELWNYYPIILILITFVIFIPEIMFFLRKKGEK